MKKYVHILMVMFLAIILPFQIAVSMQSANYKIEKDSINFGGTDDGQSASYELKDTMGEVGTGISDSASYEMKAGYRQMDMAVNPTFTFVLSANVCSLGTLSTGSVSTCNYTITTTTNAEDGYVTTIVEDGNLRDGTSDINDVLDGTVTAGSEEYGASTTDTDAAIVQTSGNAASAITGTAQTVATTASGPVSAEAFTITHHASIAATTLAGSYSHIVTLISTGTF